MYLIKNVQVDNDQEMVQSERNSHFKNPGGEKNNKRKAHREPRKQLSGGHPVTQNKNMNTYMKCKQHKIQNTTEVWPSNDQ